MPKMQLPMMAINSENVIGEEVKLFANTDGEGPIKIYIRDQIGENWFGEGVAANDISEVLEAHADRDVEVTVNSPGGSVYEGIQIYNALAMHPRDVTVTVESLAFSAASFITMSADKIRMMETSQIGIHRSIIGAYGNQNTMAAMQKWLASIDTMMVDLYMDRTGLSEQQVTDYLDGDDAGGFGTIFTAKEAVEIGFADELVESNKKKKPKDVAKAAKPGMSALGKAEMSLFLEKAHRRS